MDRPAQSQSVRPLLLSLSIGDVTGIGPEVALKAVAAELPKDDTRYLLVGDEGCLQAINQQLALGLSWTPYQNRTDTGRLWILDPQTDPLPGRPEPGAVAAAKASLRWLTEAAHLCLRGQADALVTAPVSKEAIVRSGQPFVGQTEWLSKLAGTDRTVMMLLGADEHGRWLRVALATTHVPIRQLPATLSKAKVQVAIELAAEACRRLGLSTARIGVCGLNPHAGEGGALGNEEQELIRPAVEAARAGGISVTGPLSADALFRQAFCGQYDALVAMYHDQGLVPLKMVAFDTGVNWTLGLPFIRTSPDHGTAYDLAGQGQANPASMISALRFAKGLAASR